MTLAPRMENFKVKRCHNTFTTLPSRAYRQKTGLSLLRTRYVCIMTDVSMAWWLSKWVYIFVVDCVVVRTALKVYLLQIVFAIFHWPTPSTRLSRLLVGFDGLHMVYWRTPLRQVVFAVFHWPTPSTRLSRLLVGFDRLQVVYWRTPLR